MAHLEAVSEVLLHGMELQAFSIHRTVHYHHSSFAAEPALFFKLKRFITERVLL